jgi:hypothetical protein
LQKLSNESLRLKNVPADHAANARFQMHYDVRQAETLFALFAYASMRDATQILVIFSVSAGLHLLD